MSQKYSDGEAIVLSLRLTSAPMDPRYTYYKTGTITLSLGTLSTGQMQCLSGQIIPVDYEHSDTTELDKHYSQLSW